MFSSVSLNTPATGLQSRRLCRWFQPTFQPTSRSSTRDVVQTRDVVGPATRTHEFAHGPGSCLSPDGKFVAFASVGKDRKFRLFRRPIDLTSLADEMLAEFPTAASRRRTGLQTASSLCFPPRATCGSGASPALRRLCRLSRPPIGRDGTLVSRRTLDCLSVHQSGRSEVYGDDSHRHQSTRSPALRIRVAARDEIFSVVDAEMMAVRVRPTMPFPASAGASVCNRDEGDRIPGDSALPDGKLFIMALPLVARTDHDVTNWPARLTDR